MDEYSIVPKPTDDIIEEEEFERLYTAPAEIIALLSIFYGSISVLAIIGNVLVIWVVATTRQMRTVTNMYIANLAFADVIIGLFCIPFQFQAALLQRWNLPFFMCGFCPFVQALSVNVSVFTLTAIAIDRHRAVINPLRARPSRFVSKFIIVGIWIMAFIFAIPCAIAFRVDLIHERIREGDFIYNITRPFCMNMNLSEDQLQLYRYTLVFVQYLVPFCVISFVYIQMAIKLWGTRAPGNAQDLRDITLLRNKKKVIKMLIIVVIVFGLCWLPLQLYNILYVTIPEINEYHFISIVWFCCDWLAMSNSCYNPFIYGIYNEKFKREFNKRFAACFCKFSTIADQQERATVSMHTRASSIRSTYANSSMRLRCGVAKLSFNTQSHTNFRKDNLSTAAATKNISMLKNSNAKNSNNINHSLYDVKTFGRTTNDKNFPIIDNNKIPKNDDDNAPNNGNANENLNGKSKYYWRNHFKLLHSVVVENEDNQSLLELPVSALVSASNSTAVDCQLPPDAGESADLDSSKVNSKLEKVNCICEVELGGRTQCDGTCILSEVSRVLVPLSVAVPESVSITVVNSPSSNCSSINFKYAKIKTGNDDNDNDNDNDNDTDNDDDDNIKDHCCESRLLEKDFDQQPQESKAVRIRGEQQTPSLNDFDCDNQKNIDRKSVTRRSF